MRVENSTKGNMKKHQKVKNKPQLKGGKIARKGKTEAMAN